MNIFQWRIYTYQFREMYLRKFFIFVFVTFAEKVVPKLLIKF